MSQSEEDIISEAFSFPKTDDLGKYLGILTISKRVTKVTFQDIIGNDSLVGGLNAYH